MLLLYASKACRCIFPYKAWKKREKFQDLYDKGEKKMAELLDINEIVKKLRSIDILLENSIMNKKTKFLIQHAKQN